MASNKYEIKSWKSYWEVDSIAWFVKNTTEKISKIKIREIEKKMFFKTKDFFLAFTSKNFFEKIPARFGSRGIFIKKISAPEKWAKIFFCPKISPRRPKGLIIPMVGIMVQLPTNMEILVPQLNLPLLWFATLFSCSVS